MASSGEQRPEEAGGEQGAGDAPVGAGALPSAQQEAPELGARMKAASPRHSSREFSWDGPLSSIRVASVRNWTAQAPFSSGLGLGSRPAFKPGWEGSHGCCWVPCRPVLTLTPAPHSTRALHPASSHGAWSSIPSPAGLWWRGHQGSW